KHGTGYHEFYYIIRVKSKRIKAKKDSKMTTFGDPAPLQWAEKGSFPKKMSLSYFRKIVQKL
ncbi:hypothetical protein, partial [Cyclobacterium amurskyense]|uniref:hypothetical protein n=1 Tax=Cyclobacterium amurskyense TaxID=320787 RepID=UPI0030D746C3